MDDVLLAGIENAPALIALYGRWPSFHDAAMQDVTIAADEDDPHTPTVTIRFRLNGWSNNAPGRSALATLKWREVEWLELTGVDAQNWTGGLTIERQEDGSWRTVITPQGSDSRQGIGMGGVIMSRGLAIVDARLVDPA